MGFSFPCPLNEDTGVAFLPVFMSLAKEVVVVASFSPCKPGLYEGRELRGGEVLLGWCWNNLTLCSPDMGDF